MRRGMGAWASTVMLVAGALVLPASRAGAATSMPDPPSLSGVACTSDTHCFAVGERIVGSYNRTLVKRWTGTRWALSPSPNPPGKINARFWDVSCTSDTDCFAVGTYATKLWGRTLIEHWDGLKWSIKGSPNPPGRVIAELNRISCTAGAGCIAVGDYSTKSWGRTLVERWNGTRWSIMASPNPPGRTFAGLTGVDCTAPTTCVAVGTYVTDSWARTLVERWNGGGWSIVRSANPPGRNFAALADVTCPTPTNCNAVGFVDNRTLIEHWDGAGWKIVASPNPRGTNDLVVLASIACASDTDCFAVGTYFDSAQFASQTLIEHWNGATWSIVASPFIFFPALIGVTCLSSTSCYAVGFQASGTLQEHWNGAYWSVQS